MKMVEPEQNMIENRMKAKAMRLSQFLVDKNRDYQGASFDLGLVGNVVHIWDKAKRYKNLVLDKHEPNFESVEDTLRDIAGYAIIGLLILEDEKNGR